MFDLARVRAGARVLDLGTGTGDTAILASERVGSSGQVLATDASPSMIDVARESVRASGARNVSVRVMSVDHIDVEESYDVVIARLVLMFVDDLPKALANVLRALRPGGRFGAVVWASLERNAYHRILIESALAHGCLPDPTPEMVRAFSLQDPTALERALKHAEFVDVVVRAVGCTREFPSAAEALTSARESPIQSAVFAALDDAAHAKAWARVAREYGAFEKEGACIIPGELLVASGGRAP
jgi:ubiquinone/menaquinone biosynthesis C-methylase UbiE